MSELYTLWPREIYWSDVGNAQDNRPFNLSENGESIHLIVVYTCQTIRKNLFSRGRSIVVM